jgi:hypothetical protein
VNAKLLAGVAAAALAAFGAGWVLGPDDEPQAAPEPRAAEVIRPASETIRSGFEPAPVPPLVTPTPTPAPTPAPPVATPAPSPGPIVPDPEVPTPPVPETPTPPGSGPPGSGGEG